MDMEEEGATHLDYLVQWTEGGYTMVELAKALSEDAGEEFDPAALTRYFTREFPDYTSRMDAARTIGAFAMAEQARDIVDTLKVYDEKTQLSQAVAKANVRQWTAERFNRKAFGAPKEQVNVNVSISSLHMDALRTRAIAKMAGKQTETEADLAPASHQSALPASVADEPVDVAYEVLDPL